MQSRIIELIYAAHRKLAAIESRPYDFGIGKPLYPSEVHVLEEIDRRPGLNLTETARALGISKPAVVKVVRKLLPRGLIVKERGHDNLKEVVFFLSDPGKTAVRSHEERKRLLFSSLFEFEEGLTEAERRTITGFLEGLYALLGKEAQ